MPTLRRPKRMELPLLAPLSTRRQPQRCPVPPSRDHGVRSSQRASNSSLRRVMRAPMPEPTQVEHNPSDGGLSRHAVRWRHRSLRLTTNMWTARPTLAGSAVRRFGRVCAVACTLAGFRIGCSVGATAARAYGAKRASRRGGGRRRATGPPLLSVPQQPRIHSPSAVTAYGTRALPCVPTWHAASRHALALSALAWLGSALWRIVPIANMLQAPTEVPYCLCKPARRCRVPSAAAPFVLTALPSIRKCAARPPRN